MNLGDDRDTFNFLYINSLFRVIYLMLNIRWPAQAMNTPPGKFDARLAY